MRCCDYLVLILHSSAGSVKFLLVERRGAEGGCKESWPNKELLLFSLSSGSHDRAVLLYEYIGKKLVDLQHTEVPDAYRGRGIAKHLAKVKPSPRQS